MVARPPFDSVIIGSVLGYVVYLCINMRKQNGKLLVGQGQGKHGRQRQHANPTTERMADDDDERSTGICGWEGREAEDTAAASSHGLRCPLRSRSCGRELTRRLHPMTTTTTDRGASAGGRPHPALLVDQHTSMAAATRGSVQPMPAMAARAAAAFLLLSSVAQAFLAPMTTVATSSRSVHARESRGGVWRRGLGAPGRPCCVSCLILASDCMHPSNRSIAIDQSQPHRAPALLPSRRAAVAMQAAPSGT